MPTFPFGETVTILTTTKTGVDGDGNDVLTPTPTVIPGCAFDPGGSLELTQGGDTVTTRPTVYLPDGTAVPKAADRVQVRGLTYDIDGDVAVYVNPFTGSAPGPVLRLKRVTG